MTDVQNIVILVCSVAALMGGGGSFIYLRALIKRSRSLVERARTHVAIVTGGRDRQARAFAALLRASGLRRVSVTDALPGPTLAQVAVIFGGHGKGEEYCKDLEDAFPNAVCVVLYRPDVDSIEDHIDSDGAFFWTEREIDAWLLVQATADMVGAARRSVFAARKHRGHGG